MTKRATNNYQRCLTLQINIRFDPGIGFSKAEIVKTSIIRYLNKICVAGAFSWKIHGGVVEAAPVLRLVKESVEP